MIAIIMLCQVLPELKFTAFVSSAEKNCVLSLDFNTFSGAGRIQQRPPPVIVKWVKYYFSECISAVGIDLMLLRMFEMVVGSIEPILFLQFYPDVFAASLPKKTGR